MKNCTTCKYGFVDEQLGFPMCHHPLRFSKDCVDFNLHEEIEEPEKATDIEEKKLLEGLEEAAKAYVAYLVLSGKDIEGVTIRPLRNAAENAFIAGAEWQKEQMLKEAVELECIGKKVKMTVKELIDYYIDTECCEVAEECGF